MNMMRHDWPLLEKVTPVPESRAKHLASAGIVAALHLVLIALIVTHHSVTPPPPAQPNPITIELVAAAPKQAPRLLIPKAAAPEAPVVPAPDFVVDLPQQHAITTQPPNASTAGSVASSPTGRDSYYARLISYLDSCKRYPPEARRLHIEGTVRVHLRLDRNGQVSEFAIVGSSGRPILDDEARALIARAQPLPLPPADFPDSALNLIVPVEFRLH